MTIMQFCSDLKPGKNKLHNPNMLNFLPAVYVSLVFCNNFGKTLRHKQIYFLADII